MAVPSVPVECKVDMWIKMRVPPTGARRSEAVWRLRSRSLQLGRRTLVMGIVNITPDSFSDGGRYLALEKAVAHCVRLLEDGADLLDLGAESTRPGSRAGGLPGSDDAPAVSADQEQERLLPVVEGILRLRPDAILSVDTYKSATARAAVAAGVEIVNDVSGFTWDEEMAAVCAQSGCGVVLMHTRGRPDDWSSQERLSPEALQLEVRSGLSASMQRALQAGIALEAIVLDPGYGFGKRFEENFALLARQRELLELGRPILAGLSRKSFLGRALAPLYDGADAPIEGRDTASLAAQAIAILQGASIIRSHAVRPAAEAALIADAVLAAGA